MEVLTKTMQHITGEQTDSHTTLLVDFWAPWCGPCRMLAPVLEEIEAEEQHVKVVKVNIDEQPELAQAFGIMSIPTLVVVRDDEVRATAVGLRPKADIVEMLRA